MSDLDPTEQVGDATEGEYVICRREYHLVPHKAPHLRDTIRIMKQGDLGIQLNNQVKEICHRVP